MVRSICGVTCKTEGVSPWVPNVPSLSDMLWKKSNLAFIPPRNRASAQSVRVTLKLSPLEPCSLLRTRWLPDPRGYYEGERSTGRARVTRRARDRERALGLRYPSLGRTSSFFKITSELPQLLWAALGPPSNQSISWIFRAVPLIQSDSFPRLD